MPTKTRVPAVGAEGWFTYDVDEPALLGQRCDGCGTYVFPKATGLCRNPDCRSTDFTEVELSRRGTVWSYTDAHYQPPPPFVVPGEEFEPYALAAVELGAEGMIVLGQVVTGVEVDDLHVGQELELAVETLFSDDEHDYLVWKWAPIGGEAVRS
jgi:uncharacterized OB-fold protein